MRTQSLQHAHVRPQAQAACVLGAVQGCLILSFLDCLRLPDIPRTSASACAVSPLLPDGHVTCDYEVAAGGHQMLEPLSRMLDRLHDGSAGDMVR